MYKITLYDENCSPVCDGVACFFTENLDDFEQNWRPHADEDQWKRYLRSKVGEIVTNYYGDDPELNIVQEDKNAVILFEKEVVFRDKLFKLLNAYGCEDEIYAEETHIIFCGIKFKGVCYLIGKYQMKGVCRKAFFSANDKEFQAITVWGNPVVKCSLQEKPVWYQTNSGRSFYVYSKEDFKDDSLETYCWVTIGKFSEEKLTSGTLDLMSEEMLICLFRDIPGEAG